MTDTNTTTEPVTENDFGLNELLFIKQVFDACATRGAFKAEEMSNVGTVYNKLTAFLTANGVLQTPETPTTTGDQE